VKWSQLVLSRRGQGERVRAARVIPAEHDGTVVVWVHPEGLGALRQGDKLVPAAQAILDKKAAILAVEPFLTGKDSATEYPITKHEKNTRYAGYTYGYNRSLLASRVHDILTAVAYARDTMKAKKVHLVGIDRAGPWVVLARALCGDAALSALCAPHELYLHNAQGTGVERWLQPAYEAAGAADRLQLGQERASAERAVAWLLR
jgi:hypothetical protein